MQDNTNVGMLISYYTEQSRSQYCLRKIWILDLQLSDKKAELGNWHTDNFVKMWHTFCVGDYNKGLENYSMY